MSGQTFVEKGMEVQYRETGRRAGVVQDFYFTHPQPPALWIPNIDACMVKLDTGEVVEDIELEPFTDFAKLGRRQLTCGFCGHRAALRRWSFVQEYFRASGEWRPCEAKHCALVCPLCGKENLIDGSAEKLKILRLIGLMRHHKKRVFARVGTRLGRSAPIFS